MVDMSETIIAKADQINYDDLVGGPVTIKVTDVTKGSRDQPIKIHYEGENGRPFKPCKTMRRLLVMAWGKDAKKYKGRSMRLYGDPSVKWAGAEVGGVRISHLSDIDEPLTATLLITRGKKGTFKVKPLTTSNTSTAPNDDERREARKTAVEQAKRGKKAFLEWYNSPDGKRCRSVGDLDITVLQSICDDTDKELQAHVDGQGGKDQDAPEDDIPF